MPSNSPRSPEPDLPIRLPSELLRLFLAIPGAGCGTTTLAKRLRMNDQSVSEQMLELNRIGRQLDGSAWVRPVKGKWRLTSRGLARQKEISRHSKLPKSSRGAGGDSSPTKTPLRIAAGVSATGGFLGAVTREFLKQHPKTQVKLSTPRGYERIRGLARGDFDLIVVTDEPELIRAIAKFDVEIEELFLDEFLLVADSRGSESWKSSFRHLLRQGSARAEDIAGLPLIMPEPNATRRRQFDLCFARRLGSSPDPILEIGGWDNILNFAANGVGAGLVTRQAILSSVHGGKNAGLKHLEAVKLDERDFPPLPVQLVRRAPSRKGPKQTPARQKSIAAFCRLLREQTSATSR